MEDERDLAFPLPLELTSELLPLESEFLDELLSLESDDKVIGLSIEGMSLIRTSSSVLLNRLTMFRVFFDSGTLDNMEVLDTELSVIPSLTRSSSEFNIFVLL